MHDGGSFDQILPKQVGYFETRIKLKTDNSALPVPHYVICHLFSGEIVTFDNYTVIHGRSKIDSDGERYFHGGVLDWDPVNSRIRVLKTELGMKN
jgi:hypothetical protein